MTTVDHIVERIVESRNDLGDAFVVSERRLALCLQLLLFVAEFFVFVFCAHDAVTTFMRMVGCIHEHNAIVIFVAFDESKPSEATWTQSLYQCFCDPGQGCIAVYHA